MRAVAVGGAGYIGSVTACLLREAGHEVTVIDDLSTGHRNFIEDIDFIQLNIIDESVRLAIVLQDLKPDVILHFAAKISVAESVVNPRLYFRNNTLGTLILLEEATKADCRNIVFSSSAAVYGKPQQVPIKENAPTRPINPYGHSKYLSEQILQDYERNNNLNWVAFRYFNAAGAYKNSAMDYPIMTHLIPHVIETLFAQKNLKIYGQDYPTADGTCIRDFVHVVDIAKAHVAAAEKMHKGEKFNMPINLGSGSGYSVMEVIGATEQVANKPVRSEVVSRREGDPPVLVADYKRAQEILGWQPEQTLKEMIQSHLKWRENKLSLSLV